MDFLQRVFMFFFINGEVQDTISIKSPVTNRGQYKDSHTGHGINIWFITVCEDKRVLRMRNALNDVVVKRDYMLLENNHCSKTLRNNQLWKQNTLQFCRNNCKPRSTAPLSEEHFFQLKGHTGMKADYYSDITHRKDNREVNNACFGFLYCMFVTIFSFEESRKKKNSSPVFPQRWKWKLFPSSLFFWD